MPEASAREGSARPRIGVSACLLGERVRWNGEHKRDAFLVDVVGRFAELVPVCPEMELGMGTPRPPVQLVRRDGGDGGGSEMRLVEVDSGRDHTDAMDAWAARRLAELARLDLAGFVLKKDSPSCGLDGVPVQREDGGITAESGRGRFAEALVAAFPDLPVADETRLHVPPQREHFFERVLAHRRLADFFGASWTLGDLVDFHAREKLLLLAHEPDGYRALGRLVARAKGRPPAELAASYRLRFMEAMAHVATPGRHVNALEHMAGYVTDALDCAARRELADAIAGFARGLVPLETPLALIETPLALIRSHVGRLGVEYLARQSYLEPHPLVEG